MLAFEDIFQVGEEEMKKKKIKIKVWIESN